jgi:NodT family efflux transporter outer membrane factor (OMF) lipoprotein
VNGGENEPAVGWQENIEQWIANVERRFTVHRRPFYDQGVKRMFKKDLDPQMKRIYGILPRLLGGLIALSLLLSGCAMVGPDYKPPEVKEPKEWIEKEEPKIKTEPENFGTWWTTLNDPVLDRLIETAYKQNLPLQIAGIRILEARARLGFTKGTLYPQTQEALGSYTRVNASENRANTPAPNLFDSNYSDYEVSFDAAWELDFWGRFRRAVQSSIRSFEVSIADYDNTLVTLTAEVARSYVVIRTLEERLAIAQENVKIQERSLQIARVRFKGGEVSELDVSQATALLKGTQALIPRLQADLRQSKNALNILLGILPGESEELLIGSTGIPSVPAEVAVGIPAELLRRRPDIRSAERRMAAQSSRIGLAKADLYPHFTLFGSIGFAAGNSADLFDSNSFEAFGGPAVNWDLFNYGRIKNRVRIQDALFQELIVDYQNTVLKAAKEVEDAMVAFLRTEEEANILAESVRAYKRSVDLSMLQYREGLIDYQRVLDTQRFLTQAQEGQIATQGSVVVNLIAMYKALGGGWETRIGKDFVPEDIKKQMEERTDWGNLLTPKKLEEPPANPKLWQAPDW